MKITSLLALIGFALFIGLLALLSYPEEDTRIAMYLDDNKLENAEELLWKRHARNPDDLQTVAQLANVLTMRGQKERAKEFILDALRRFPDNLELRQRMALILLAEKDPHGAAQILEPSERSPEIWKLLAWEYQQIKSYDLADEALLAAYLDDKDKLEFWRTLALWRGDRADLEGERIALEAALKEAPDDLDLLGRYLHNRSRANDVTTALAIAARLKKAKPLERGHLNDLYLLERSRNNYQAARQIIEQMLALKDSGPADSLALASIMYAQGNLTEAQQVLEDLANSGKPFPKEIGQAIFSQTLEVRAGLLFKAALKGDEHAVLAALNSMENLVDSTAPDVVRNMIYACLALSDFFKAAAAEQKFAEPDKMPESIERERYWLDRAKAIFTRYEQALPFTQIVNARVAADLAERYEDWPALRRAWRIVVEKEAEDPGAWLGLARAAQHLGDNQECLESLRKVEELGPSDQKMRLALALQYQALAQNMPDKALQREQIARHADGLAMAYLADAWEDTLARNLFYSSVACRNVARAEAVLAEMELRGIATPWEYLGIAEAYLPASAKGSGRGRIAANARKAVSADFPEAWPRLLYIFLSIEDKEQIRKVLELIAKSPLPKSTELLRQMAYAEGYLGNLEAEIALLEQRARLTGKVADWAEIVDRKYRAGDFPAALEILARAEAIHPRASELLDRRVQILVAMDDLASAIRNYNQAKRKDARLDEKLSAQAFSSLGLAYERSNLPDRARLFYRQALKKNPGDFRAASGMAAMARRSGNMAEAARYLQACLERDPKNLWAKLELAALKPEQGKKRYKQILAETKPDAQGRLSKDERVPRALALWRTGRMHDARKIYAQLMRETAQNPSINSDYAQLLSEMGASDEAEKILAKTIKDFPEHILAYRQLANVYALRGNYGQARQFLKQALHLSPNNAGVLRDLSALALSQKNPAKRENTGLMQECARPFHAFTSTPLVEIPAVKRITDCLMPSLRLTFQIE